MNKIILGFVVFVVSCSGKRDNLLIHDDFPGGNIIVDSIVENTVYVRPDQNGTDTAKGDWFYWQFQVEGAEGRQLQFYFNQEHAITRKGPSYSLDNAMNWSFLFPENLVDTNAITFSFDDNDTLVRFGLTIPYVKTDWEWFVEANKDAFEAYVKTSVLTETSNGRDVNYYTIKHPKQEIRRILFFTARHHACESTASFVLEGIMKSFLDRIGKNDALIQGIQLIAIPFMDLDGVQSGEQGKNRYPHDHNRDYQKFFYSEPRALDSLFTKLTDCKPTLIIDLHSPWIKYNQNETLFFIGQERIDFSAKLKDLANIIQSTHKGNLPFDSESAIFPFGKDWNNRTMTESLDNQLLSFSQWGAMQENVFLASTLEIPYANVKDVPVSKKNLREFGQALLEALLLLE
jgi:hypothetical protein